MSKTPLFGHPPIRMRRVLDDDAVQQRGDFFWRIDDQGRRTLVVAIPCERGHASGWCYSHWTIDHKNHCDAQWSWDKNEEAPTLHPSLHAVGVWHGWVRAGQLVEAR